MSVATPVQIFGAPHSNFVRGVRIVMSEKSISYDYHPVAPHSAEARALHPLGLVPGLRHGDVALAESQAIVAYLDSLWPLSPMGPSGSVAETAEVTQWISIVASAVDQTLIRRYVVPYAFPKGPEGLPDRASIEAVLPDLRNIFGALETRLSGRDYLAANRFTFADALLLATLQPTLRRPEACAISADTPCLCQYFGRLSRRKSFVETEPPA